MEPAVNGAGGEDAVVQTLAKAFRTLLEALGENPDRQGLRKTPERAAKALLFFTSGYGQDVRGEVVCYGLLAGAKLQKGPVESVGPGNAAHISYKRQCVDTVRDVFIPCMAVMSCGHAKTVCRYVRSIHVNEAHMFRTCMRCARR